MGLFDIIDDIAEKQVMKTETGDNRVFGVMTGINGPEWLCQAVVRSGGIILCRKWVIWFFWFWTKGILKNHL